MNKDFIIIILIIKTKKSRLVQKQNNKKKETHGVWAEAHTVKTHSTAKRRKKLFSFAQGRILTERGFKR